MAALVKVAEHERLTMKSRYSFSQKNEFLAMIDRIGAHWLDVFEGKQEFYSAIYWDLLIGLWRQDTPVKKTDALAFMKTVKSAQTARKCLEVCLRWGVLLEKDNPRMPGRGC